MMMVVVMMARWLGMAVEVVVVVGAGVVGAVDLGSSYFIVLLSELCFPAYRDGFPKGRISLKTFLRPRLL